MATGFSEMPLNRLISLPRELLQTILSTIANFEPWTYSSTPTHNNASKNNGDPALPPLGGTPQNSKSINGSVIGLSSDNNWLINIFSRHPYHLIWRDNLSISSAVARAVRRMNAHVEQEYRELGARPKIRSLEVSENTADTNLKHYKSASLQHEPEKEDVIAWKPTFGSMKPYHATIQDAEDDSTRRQVPDGTHADRDDVHMSSPSNALVLYSPAPVLKLSHLDMIRTAKQHDLREVNKNKIALLIVAVAVLAQCRLNLLEALEEVERDIPVPSIESCGIKDFAARKTSPRPDRTRSLSGSTIAETLPNDTPLSLSAISTVYDLGDEPKQVRWAEKRVTDERDTEVPPKRPKLDDYKRVSSGRVAMLMDRFEKLHL